jgi:outer membrane protein assembly factor BamD
MRFASRSHQEHQVMSAVQRDRQSAPLPVGKSASSLVVTIALMCGVLAGCASSNDAAKALNPDPPDQMYAAADRALQRGSYSEAARKFEDLDRDHPYAQEARRAVVMSSYAYYKAGKYPEAIASAQRYTTLHPGTKEAALAHHIIASANFDEIREPTKDQTATRKALGELKLLRQRYPDSPYAKQAENRVRIAEDILAASEMNVGRYYLKNRNHIAAINRFKTVVVEYQTTAHVEEALYRLVESNMSLGIVSEAQAAASVLGHNYPSSTWYKDSYALLKSGGVSPQSATSGWLANALKSVTPSAKEKPLSKPAAAEPNSLPLPDQMPAPRAPSSDIPTASTTKPKSFGLGVTAATKPAQAE